MRDFAGDHNHQQPGDPARLAHALLQLGNTDQPSLRLLLGMDALARIAKKNASVEGETEKWHALAASTDF